MNWNLTSLRSFAPNPFVLYLEPVRFLWNRWNRRTTWYVTDDEWNFKRIILSHYFLLVTNASQRSSYIILSCIDQSRFLFFSFWCCRVRDDTWWHVSTQGARAFAGLPGYGALPPHYRSHLPTATPPSW